MTMKLRAINHRLNLKRFKKSDLNTDLRIGNSWKRKFTEEAQEVINQAILENEVHPIVALREHLGYYNVEQLLEDLETFEIDLKFSRELSISMIEGNKPFGNIRGN